MINLRLWRQVLTWSSSARRPFRLIDRTLSAGEEYCAVALISAVIEKISHRCVFHPVLPGQLGLTASSLLFFFSPQKVQRHLSWGYPMPLGSWKKPVWACSLTEALQGCSFSELQPFVCFYVVSFVCFFCVLAGEKKKKHVGHHVVTIPLPLAPKLFVFFFLTLVKFAPWSNVAESPKSHQLK